MEKSQFVETDGSLVGIPNPAGNPMNHLMTAVAATEAGLLDSIKSW